MVNSNYKYGVIISKILRRYDNLWCHFYADKIIVFSLKKMLIEYLLCTQNCAMCWDHKDEWGRLPDQLHRSVYLAQGFPHSKNLIMLTITMTILILKTSSPSGEILLVFLFDLNIILITRSWQTDQSGQSVKFQMHGDGMGQWPYPSSSSQDWWLMASLSSVTSFHIPVIEPG